MTCLGQISLLGSSGVDAECDVVIASAGCLHPGVSLEELHEAARGRSGLLCLDD